MSEPTAEELASAAAWRRENFPGISEALPKSSTTDEVVARLPPIPTGAGALWDMVYDLRDRLAAVEAKLTAVEATLVEQEERPHLKSTTCPRCKMSAVSYPDVMTVCPNCMTTWFA